MLVAHLQRRRLTEFFDVLQTSKPTSVFIPTRTFRGLSPNNPYAKKAASGLFKEVEPQKIAMRLINCRLQLAETWEGELTNLTRSDPDGELSERISGSTTLTNLSGVVLPSSNGDTLARSLLPGVETRDTQLLRGQAMRLAAKEFLRDLALLPSQVHVHQWLSSFVLVNHATDLTAEGSVHRLITDLVSQPVHIRGSALVDPMEISRELVTRTDEILRDFIVHLREAPSDHARIQADWLEACLGLAADKEDDRDEE